MTIARRQLVDAATTPYYHCMARCVRRAFLCGRDEFSGQNYEHRKQWVVDRLAVLAQAFTLEVCAYAVMSNHYHVVLGVLQEKSNALTDQEILSRWALVFPGSLATDYTAGITLDTPQKEKLSLELPLYRLRLNDISWFMRCLNEHIARKANQEDRCKGRFWEGRFKSQALLDEGALLACMAYVDLNPIRAKVCKTLDTSDYTSIQQRIALAPNHHHGHSKKAAPTAAVVPLMPLRLANEPLSDALPFSLSLAHYLELVTWTGKAIRKDKLALRGAEGQGDLPKHLAPLLQQFSLNEKQWLHTVTHFQHRFFRVAGPLAALKQLSTTLNLHWLKGVAAARQVYLAPAGA